MLHKVREYISAEGSRLRDVTQVNDVMIFVYAMTIKFHTISTHLPDGENIFSKVAKN